MSDPWGQGLAALASAITELDSAPLDADFETLASAVAQIDADKQSLAIVYDSLAAAVAEKMTDYRQTVPGVGTLERHPKSKKEECDEVALYRLVCDSRRVDPDTGEAESLPDTILEVYGSRSKETGELRMPLRYVTRGALKERGIDPKAVIETVEQSGWTLRIHAA